jgi:hypothetical protein
VSFTLWWADIWDVLRSFLVAGAAVGMASSESSDAFAGLLFGFGAVIFLPIFYGILGFIFGLIGALLYNGIARLIGGIEIELEETRHASSSNYS